MVKRKKIVDMMIHDGSNGFWNKFLIVAGSPHRHIYYTVADYASETRNPLYIINLIKRNVKN